MPIPETLNQIQNTLNQIQNIFQESENPAGIDLVSTLRYHLICILRSDLASYQEQCNLYQEQHKIYSAKYEQIVLEIATLRRLLRELEG